MTTLKQIFDKLNIPQKQRVGPQNLDIGDYTFTDVDHSYDFVWDFINKNNPHIVLRIHEDRGMVILYKEEGDKVEATTWTPREKVQRTLDIELFNKIRNEALEGVEKQ